MLGSTMDIEQDYFHWLCEMIHIDHGNTSYWLVAKDLHRKPFIAVIERDENRAMDGMNLRDQYMDENWRTNWGEIEGECSVLEMLIALAQRMDFETSDAYDEDEEDTNKTSYWFWEMLDNLGLTSFDDDSYVDLNGQIYVDRIIDDFVERRYDRNGHGGIFPLDGTGTDQRNVEIWYQMSSYLYENGE